VFCNTRCYATQTYIKLCTILQYLYLQLYNFQASLNHRANACSCFLNGFAQIFMYISSCWKFLLLAWQRVSKRWKSFLNLPLAYETAFWIHETGLTFLCRELEEDGWPSGWHPSWPRTRSPVRSLYVTEETKFGARVKKLATSFELCVAFCYLTFNVINIS
jgi:hypothetical protein